MAALSASLLVLVMPALLAPLAIQAAELLGGQPVAAVETRTEASALVRLLAATVTFAWQTTMVLA